MIMQLRQLLRDERGTSMTEFVMFTPIFIVIFAGVVNLGKFGVVTTQVQMKAQQQMWDEAIQVSYSLSDGAEHATTISGGGEAAATNFGYVTEAPTARATGYTYNGGVMTLLGTTGHWGESYGRVKPFHLISIATVEPEITAKNIISEQPYPQAILNDGLNRPMPDGLVGIVTSILSGSGAIPAIGAGIRYGEAFGEEVKNFNVGRAGSFQAQAHYDVLVPPSPLKGLETKITFGLAWAMAQTEDNYYNLLIFGDGDGLEGDGSNGTTNVDDYIDGANDTLDTKDEKVEEAEEELEAQQEAEEAAQNGGGG